MLSLYKKTVQCMIIGASRLIYSSCEWGPAEARFELVVRIAATILYYSALFYYTATAQVRCFAAAWFPLYYATTLLCTIPLY